MATFHRTIFRPTRKTSPVPLTSLTRSVFPSSQRDTALAGRYRKTLDTDQHSGAARPTALATRRRLQASINDVYQATGRYVFSRATCHAGIRKPLIEDPMRRTGPCGTRTNSDEHPATQCSLRPRPPSSQQASLSEKNGSRPSDFTKSIRRREATTQGIAVWG